MSSRQLTYWERFRWKTAGTLIFIAAYFKSDAAECTSEQAFVRAWPLRLAGQGAGLAFLSLWISPQIEILSVPTVSLQGLTPLPKYRSHSAPMLKKSRGSAFAWHAPSCIVCLYRGTDFQQERPCHFASLFAEYCHLDQCGHLCRILGNAMWHVCR